MARYWDKTEECLPELKKLTGALQEFCFKNHLPMALSVQTAVGPTGGFSSKVGFNHDPADHVMWNTGPLIMAMLMLMDPHYVEDALVQTLLRLAQGAVEARMDELYPEAPCQPPH